MAKFSFWLSQPTRQGSTRRAASRFGSRRSGLALIPALLLAFDLGSVSAQAQSQPSPDKQQPLHIVVPYPPGGGIDYLARLVAPELRDKLGQTVIVENRLGATGMIATSAVARTLLFGNLAIFVINPILSPNVSYDVARDFVPVSRSGVFEFVLVVNPKVLPVSSLPELLAAARQTNGGLNYASSGIGAVPHLLMELFPRQTKVNLVPVHYRGGATALQDLVSGQVGVMFLDYSTARTHVESGRLRIIAAASDQRLEVLPDVPTLAELGVKGVTAGGWVGMAMRSGTPTDVVDRIYKAYAEAIRSPDLRKHLIDAGFSPASSTGADFGRFIQAESVHWREVIRERGIKAE